MRAANVYPLVAGDSAIRGRILAVGAGMTSAVIARQLAEAGFLVVVFDQRAYMGGNCYTYVDDATNITVHAHGPHIFHTNDEIVWHYVNQFADFRPYICQVKATSGGRVYSLPVNLLTINQFFGTTLSPSEARAFISAKADHAITEVRSFEDQALRFVGRELYEAFFHGYPIKQWGIHPRELPASVLKRLPVRFDYNDNYFDHRFQGIPSAGYTRMIDNLLDHPAIEVTLNRKFDPTDAVGFDHVFYSGAIDEWFHYDIGLLGYRTLDFEKSTHRGDFQGCAVMSYPEQSVPFTRITEHKYFMPWHTFDQTVVFHEYSRACQRGDVPFYPIRLVEEKSLLSHYVERARQLKNVSFVGRLGTYRYLDMDVCVKEALELSKQYIVNIEQQAKQPVFFNSPL
jgi:UDP-galactopyranose mutase